MFGVCKFVHMCVVFRSLCVGVYESMCDVCEHTCVCAHVCMVWESVCDIYEHICVICMSTCV